VIFGPEDVAVLHGWEPETTSGRWIARVDIKRGASFLEVIDFWVDGSAAPRIRSFAQSGPTQSVDEKVMRALTMVIQDRIRVAFASGELFGPVGLTQRLTACSPPRLPLMTSWTWAHYASRQSTLPSRRSTRNR